MLYINKATSAASMSEFIEFEHLNGLAACYENFYARFVINMGSKCSSLFSEICIASGKAYDSLSFT